MGQRSDRRQVRVVEGELRLHPRRTVPRTRAIERDTVERIGECVHVTSVAHEEVAGHADADGRHPDPARQLDDDETQGDGDAASPLDPWLRYELRAS